MRRELLADIHIKPIVWGVIGYCVAYSIFVILMQVSGIASVEPSTAFVLVWLLSPALIAGFCIGVIATQRHVAHGVYVILLGSVAVALRSFSVVDFIATIVWSAIPLIAGVAIGKMVSPKISQRLPVERKAVGKLDVIALVASMVVPIGIGVMWASARTKTVESACASSVVDEACVRERCESRVREKLRVQENELAGIRMYEHELVRESAAPESVPAVWLVRGVATVINEDEGQPEKYRMYFCRVGAETSAAVKTGALQSGQYPAKGTPLREAFETNWSR